MIDSQTYFAEVPFFEKDFAAESFSFMDAWIQHCHDCGYDYRWTQNWFLYFGSDSTKSDDGQFDEHSFEIVGENGELMQANYNDYRNLLQHILNMTVSQPPNMTAQAINDDTESLVAAQTFDGIFSYYMNTYRGARLLKESRKTVEYSLVGDTGWFLGEWDPSLGRRNGVKTEPVLDEMGQPVLDALGKPQKRPVLDDRGQEIATFEGDFYFKARSQWDVFFDPGCQDEDEADWVIVRDQVNKFEYAQRFPKDKARILASDLKSSERLTQWRRGTRKPSKTNLIEVYKFYHRPTAMMPKGRYAILLDADTVLLDGPNPYEILPVFSVRAMEGLGSIVGYAPANVIAPVQMSKNVLTSAMMTNFAMFGVQNVAVKDTDQYDVQEIAGSLNVLKYSDEPPQALQLAAQANGILDYYQVLNRKDETLSGVNSVTRGDPESSLKSGKALGIVQAAAVQFQSALAASFASFLQAIGNFMLYVFRKYVTSERVTQIVGENEKQQSVTWTGATFGPIDRVTAELVDPAMRTLGYKTDLAMFLAQNGMVNTAQEFLTVLTTGQLKPLYRAEMTELNTIHQENSEMLKAARSLAEFDKQLQAEIAAGTMDPTTYEAQMDQMAMQLAPPVMRDDNDDLHMGEHKAVAGSPAARRNSTVTRIYIAHANAHDANKLAKAVKAAVDAAKVQAAVQTAVMQILPPMPAMAAPSKPAPAQQAQPQELPA